MTQTPEMTAEEAADMAAEYAANPPAAVGLARPCMFVGVVGSIMAAAMVSGKMELGLSLFWEVMILAVSIAVLIFGVLAALSWRIALTAMNNEEARLAALEKDAEDEAYENEIVHPIADENKGKDQT